MAETEHTNFEQVEHAFQCPYCWKTVSVLLDISVVSQTYIEDCEGCCHPIQISYSVEEGMVSHFEAERAQ